LARERTKSQLMEASNNRNQNLIQSTA